MSKRVFNITVRDVATEPAAEIRISGPIGETFWDDSGTSARKFTDALSAIPDGRKINLRINSEGGSVQDGLEIYNAIKERSSDITAYITGYAVSIASVIPLAASKVVSPKSALWMIHKPWMYANGNADEMRKAAEMLDKHEDVLLAIYQEETGLDRDSLAKDLSEEKWMTGEEAVAYGLADETNDDPAELDSVENRFGYRRAPAAMGAIAPPQRNNNKERSTMGTATNNTPSAGAATPAEDINAVKAELAEARKALDAAKRERITRTVDGYIAERKLMLDARTETIDAAMRDESILNIIAKVPKVEGFSVPRDSTVTAGAACGLDHVNRLTDPKARCQLILDNFSEFRRQGRQFAPQAANTGTDSATLLGTFLDNRVITVLQTKLVALKAFSLDASGDAMVPMKPVILRKVTAGGTAQTNATNFEDTTNFVGTVAAVTATPSQYTSGGYLTNAEYNSGNMLDQWSTIKAQELAEKALGVITALILTGTFTTSVQTIAAGSFGIADLNDFWGSLAKAMNRYAVLSSTYLAKILPTDRQSLNPLNEGLYGWDGIIPNDYWTGATANTVGFFCDKQAIGVVAGVPVSPPSAADAGLSQTNITVPGLLNVQRNGWFSKSTRSDWFTLDIVLGAAVLDASAGRILKSS